MDYKDRFIVFAEKKLSTPTRMDNIIRILQIVVLKLCNLTLESLKQIAIL